MTRTQALLICCRTAISNCGRDNTKLLAVLEKEIQDGTGCDNGIHVCCSRCGHLLADDDDPLLEETILFENWTNLLCEKCAD